MTSYSTFPAEDVWLRSAVRLILPVAQSAIAAAALEPSSQGGYISEGWPARRRWCGQRAVELAQAAVSAARELGWVGGNPRVFFSSSPLEPGLHGCQGDLELDGARAPLWPARENSFFDPHSAWRPTLLSPHLAKHCQLRAFSALMGKPLLERVARKAAERLAEEWARELAIRARAGEAPELLAHVERSMLSLDAPSASSSRLSRSI